LQAEFMNRGMLTSHLSNDLAYEAILTAGRVGFGVATYYANKSLFASMQGKYEYGHDVFVVNPFYTGTVKKADLAYQYKGATEWVEPYGKDETEVDRAPTYNRFEQSSVGS